MTIIWSFLQQKGEYNFQNVIYDVIALIDAAMAVNTKLQEILVTSDQKFGMAEELMAN